MKKTTSKKVLIPKVTSIGDLFQKAATDERYAKLAIAAASNLGGVCKDLREARQWLECNANESDGGERGVVGEINFCRDLVADANEVAHD